MSGADLEALFGATLGGAAALATAPILALGLGVVLFLVADITPVLRASRRIVFAAALAAATACELWVLLADAAPGVVLGGTYAADATTALWGLLFLAATALAWSYSQGYYGNEPFKAEHDALLLTAPAGMMLMVGARDLLVFFVGLELLSIPLYALCAFQRARMRSVEAGLKYFLLGSFSSAIFLYGAALLYASAGSLRLADILASDLTSATALAGAALVSVSLFFKLAVFPFHLWVPDVYEGSPTPVTALMSGGTKAAAFGFLLRAFELLPSSAALSVALLALVTIALGNLGALAQVELKRMLAYSGIAHAGTLLLLIAGGLAGAQPAEATRAALFYLVAYLFSATGAFGIVSVLEAGGSGATRLEALRGLGRRRPALSAALALFLLSLGGIPATGGFLGKWFVFAVLVRADLIVVALVGALLSVIGLAYYLRVIVALYMQASESEPAYAPLRRPWAKLATGVCCFIVVLSGFLPGLFLRWME